MKWLYCIISQRAATWRCQRGWLIVYRWSFFLSFFIPELISAVSYKSAELFLPTHVSWLRVVNARLEFRLYICIISQGAKNAQKCIFHVFFTGWLHVFDHCAKTGWARRNPKTIYDDFSFIRYITDYCGASSSPDHPVQTLIKFRKGMFSLMATSSGYCALIIVFASPWT